MTELALRFYYKIDELKTENIKLKAKIARLNGVQWKLVEAVEILKEIDDDRDDPRKVESAYGVVNKALAAAKEDKI